MQDEFPHDWTTIRKFAETDENFTENSIRHYVKNAERLGLEAAIIRAGGRILLSRARWYAALQARAQERRNRRIGR